MVSRIAAAPTPYPSPLFYRGGNSGTSPLLAAATPQPSNPWIDFFSNAATDLGYGLTHSTNLSGALGAATQQTAALQPYRDSAAAAKSASAEKTAQTNYSIEAFKKAGRDDLVQMANAGMLDQAWSQFLKSPAAPIAVGKDTTLVDPNTLKPVFTNTAGDTGSGGPFDGTGMDAQVGNILLRGDPATADYAYAYSVASQPKMTLQQTPNGLVPVYQSPDLSSVRPPTYRGSVSTAPGLVPEPQGGPLASPAPQGQPPAQTTVGGVTVGSALSGTQAPKTEAQQRMDLLGGQLVHDLPTVIQNYDILGSLTQKALGTTKLTSWANSPEYKQANNALRASIGNIVYAVSGANSTAQEQQRKIDEVMPAVNDDPTTLMQKKQRLAVYVNQIAAASNDPDLKAQAEAILQQLTGGAPAGKVVYQNGPITIEELPN
jgi:hypothetical protein